MAREAVSDIDHTLKVLRAWGVKVPKIHRKTFHPLA